MVCVQYIFFCPIMQEETPNRRRNSPPSSVFRLPRLRLLRDQTRRLLCGRGVKFCRRKQRPARNTTKGRHMFAFFRASNDHLQKKKKAESLRDIFAFSVPSSGASGTGDRPPEGPRCPVRPGDSRHYVKENFLPRAAKCHRQKRGASRAPPFCFLHFLQ